MIAVPSALYVMIVGLPSLPSVMRHEPTSCLSQGCNLEQPERINKERRNPKISFFIISRKVCRDEILCTIGKTEQEIELAMPIYFLPICKCWQ